MELLQQDEKGRLEKLGSLVYTRRTGKKRPRFKQGGSQDPRPKVVT